MEKRQTGDRTERNERSAKRMRKLTDYGRQLQEKQKVKEIYGLREKQFRRFFKMASKSAAAPGEVLLTLLERRLDNIVFRLKLSTTRKQARQVIVHGHIFVNGKRVHSPSYLVSPSDEICLAPQVINKSGLLEQVIDKKLNTAAKVPDWLELDKKARIGRILREPVRSDIQTPIEEYYIVDLYSK